MRESFEHKGKWRLPGSERSWDGTLKFSHNEAVTLDLEGSFGEDDNYFEILLGVTNKGERITVVDANIDELVLFPNTGNEIRKFSCNLVLTGAHFNQFNEIKFRKMYLNPSYLTEWMLPPKTFSEDLFHEIPETENSERIYQIKEKKIKYEAKLNSLHSKLIFNLELRHFGDYAKTCEFKYIAYLIIEPEEPRELNWFIDLNENLCNFLTLITRHTIYSDNLGGVIGENTNVNIHFSLYEPKTSRKISRNISTHDIDIKFSDLNYFQGKSYIDFVLNNWFEKKDSLGHIYELFHMISYIPFLYKETYFLTLMQALEVFYGQVCKEHKYLGKGEWKSVRDKLIKAIPEGLEEDLEENIENRITYGNTYSLKTKMKILFENQHLIYLRRAYGDFGEDKIKKICDTRDYFTHHVEDYEDKIFRETELDEINDILKLSLIVLILDEIGVPNGIINKILGRKIIWLGYYYKRDHTS